MNPHFRIPLIFVSLSVFTALSGCDRSSTGPAETPSAEESSPKPAEKKVSDPKTADGVKHVDADAAGNLLDTDDSVVILDIRTPQEFAEGHIQEAINIDFKAPTFRDEVAKLDRDKSYLIHCRSGGRSSQSLSVFEELGFTGIIHLDGGYLAWKEAGNPHVTE